MCKIKIMLMIKIKIMIMIMIMIDWPQQNCHAPCRIQMREDNGGTMRYYLNMLFNNYLNDP